MSEYKFKNLSEIDMVAEPSEGTTIMGFENGTPIQMPMGAVKGSGAFIINPDDPEYSNTDTVYGNKIKEALLSGKSVWRYNILPASTTNNDHPYDVQGYEQLWGFSISEDAKGHIIMLNDGNSDDLIFRITVN